MKDSRPRLLLDADEAMLSPGSLGDAALRQEISPAAVRLFTRLCDLWGLSVNDRLTLLGGLSRQTYHNWQSGRVSALARDQLERISLLLGIHKGMKLVFAEDAAGLRWLKSDNRDAAFGGRSPLARALDGSIDDLYALRRYLDAWRGGR